MSSPVNRIIQSPKNVFYLRPDVGSRWLGPPDDRVWVPALDWPEGLAAPLDPEAELGGAQSQRAPAAMEAPRATQAQYAVAASRSPPTYATHHDGAFPRSSGPPPLSCALMPPLGEMASPEFHTRTHREYTGPFANTMRQRDLGIARRQEGDRRRQRDRASTRKFEGEDHLRDRDHSGPRCDESRHITPGGPDRAREHHLRGRKRLRELGGGGRIGTPEVPDPRAGPAIEGHQQGGTQSTDALPRAPRDAGIWGDLSIDEVPSARNLVWWWSHGCPKACAYGKFIMAVYGNEQLRRRSDGVQYVLRHAHSANQNYLGAATGDSTPISRRDPNTVPRQVRRKLAKERARREGRGPTTGAVTTTPTANTPVEEDDAMPPAEPLSLPSVNPVASEPFMTSYPGSSPAPASVPESMTAHWLGPQMSLHDVMAHAATERPSDWAQGMRTAAGAWPTMHTPVGTLRAARLLHFLPPTRRDSSHRDAWMASVLRGFSVWGLFERHVQLGAWIHSANELEHYPFDATNITYSQSMQWIHAHGVDRGSEAAQELHAFAASWRNLVEGLPTTNGQSFSGHDIENNESVLRWDIGRISSWTTLWHAPVRSGVMSLSDRCPADGVRRTQRRGASEDTQMVAELSAVRPTVPEEGEIQASGAPEAPNGESAVSREG
ncbi:hypothetical protein K438DRAFT_1991389 [Mycena galopus ATCC 62051]|nr:hypothetical protein K438DRAFT_1991389 [Mycena galopus ATCC 62051]